MTLNNIILNLIENILKTNNSGHLADIGTKALLSNRLNDDEPFQAIELNNVQYLLQMMREADNTGIYIENNTFYFMAYYSHSNDYPVGRSYFIRVTNLFETTKLMQFFENNDIHLEIIPPLKFREITKEEDCRDRIKIYKKQKEIEVAHIRRLYEGRKHAGIIESAKFLDTSGCLICKNSDCFMMTSTMENDMLIFYLCQKHMDESTTYNSLIEYLAQYFNLPFSDNSKPLDTKSHLDLVISELPSKISAIIEKYDNNTITLKRKSNFKLILRLDSFINYAYIIKDPHGKEVARFDSANHHDINYGPDHLHLNPQKNKKLVHSSFTTGTPLNDINAILTILEKKEQDYDRQQKGTP